MQSTRKTRRQLYHETKPGRHPRYRRVVPPELRHLFSGKAEFVRTLKTLSYDQAHEDYERIAMGAPKVQRVMPLGASHPWPADPDLSYLRHLAETGGDVIGRADDLARTAQTIRSNIALGLMPEGEGEAVAAKLERLARQARGEKVNPKVTLKDASNRFLATVTAPGTRKQYVPRIGDIVSWFGEARDVRDITRAECREFAQTTVHQIPAHWSKKYPGLTLKQAIKRGEAEGTPTIKFATKDGYVTLIRRLFSWIRAEEMIEVNPALELPSPQGRKGKRRGFEAGHLKTIFTSAPYAPDQRDSTPGWFWVPLLALFTGARLSEVVMLRRDDLKHARGVDYFDLREDPEAGRTLKTSTSVREVPIIHELAKIGLLEYAETIPEGGWLFPDLHGVKNPTDAFGKAYGRHLDGLGIKDPCLVMHSYRHSWSTACRDSGIEKRFADRIGGWASEGAAEDYGDYRLKTLHRELSKLSYEVNLAHLHRNPIARSEGEFVQRVEPTGATP